MKDKKLKQIDVDISILYIYLFIAILFYYAKKCEKMYIQNGSIFAKEKYRQLLVIVFSVAVVICLYYFIINYNNLYKQNFNNFKIKRLTMLSFLGSLFLLLSGIIFLYIAFTDTEMDVDLSFL